MEEEDWKEHLQPSVGSQKLLSWTCLEIPAFSLPRLSAFKESFVPKVKESNIETV